MGDENQTDFAKVQAMLTAWRCLQEPQFAGMTVLAKAKWLMSMGFSRSDAATVLGSTDESLRVMFAAEARKARGSTPKR